MEYCHFRMLRHKYFHRARKVAVSTKDLSGKALKKFKEQEENAQINKWIVQLTVFLSNPLLGCKGGRKGGTAGEAPRIDLAQWRDLRQVYMCWYEAVLSIKNKKQIIRWESFV